MTTFMSEQVGEIAGALAKAQAEIQNPEKNALNPHFKNSYADIASGLNAVRPALSKHGLAVVQLTRLEGDLLLLDTKIIHSSGQWIASVYPVCKFPIAQQQMGSALTYSRRYALFAIVGIAGEDDDDGNDASKDKVPAQERREKPAPQIVADDNPFPGDDPSPKPVIKSGAPEGIKAYIDFVRAGIDAAKTANELDAICEREERLNFPKYRITKGSTIYNELGAYASRKYDDFIKDAAE